MLAPNKLTAFILKLLIMTILVNLLIWYQLLESANRMVSDSTRLIARTAAVSGCLPENDVLGFKVISNSGESGIEQPLKTVSLYQDTLESQLKQNGLILQRFMQFDSNAISVKSVSDGRDLYKFETAAERGEWLEVTVRAKVTLPIPFYIGWEGEGVPMMKFPIVKSMRVKSLKYRNTD